MSTVGPLLRTWRGHRNLSQLALADEAEVSQRHLSCVESGKSKPSRELVLHLARVLDVPARHRNDLLDAAGFSPEYVETPLDDPSMASVRQAVGMMLRSHEPLPAVLVNRYWDLLDLNDAALLVLGRLIGDLDVLNGDTPNIQALTFDRNALGKYLVNRGPLAAAFLEHSRRDARLDPGDDRLAAQVAHLEEIIAADGGPKSEAVEAVVPMRLETPDGDLQLFSTLATVTTPGDLTTHDLMVELFFPADDATEAWMLQR